MVSYNDIKNIYSTKIQKIEEDKFQKNIEYNKELQSLNLNIDFDPNINIGRIAAYVDAFDLSEEYIQQFNTRQVAKKDFNSYYLILILEDFRKLASKVCCSDREVIFEDVQKLENKYLNYRNLDDPLVSKIIKDIEKIRQEILDNINNGEYYNIEVENKIQEFIKDYTDVDFVDVKEPKLECSNISLYENIEVLKALSLQNTIYGEGESDLPADDFIIEILQIISKRERIIDMARRNNNGEINPEIDELQTRNNEVKEYLKTLLYKMGKYYSQSKYHENIIKRLEITVKGIENLKILQDYNNNIETFTEIYHAHNIDDSLKRESTADDKIAPKVFRDIFSQIFNALTQEYDPLLLDYKLKELEVKLRTQTLPYETIDIEEYKKSEEENLLICQKFMRQIELTENILSFYKEQHEDTKSALIDIKDIPYNTITFSTPYYIEDLLQRNKELVKELEIGNNQISDLEIYTSSKLAKILQNCANSTKFKN